MLLTRIKISTHIGGKRNHIRLATLAQYIR